MSERMASTSLYERAEHATRVIRARINVEPRIAVVLGSGLGGFADDFDEVEHVEGAADLKAHRVAVLCHSAPRQEAADVADMCALE